MDHRLRIAIACAVIAVTGAALLAGTGLVRRSSGSVPAAPALVLVPAGEFTMGSHADDPDAQPARRVYVDAFYIGQYEVTNLQYVHFLNATDGSADRCAGQVCLDTQPENPESHILPGQKGYVVEKGYERHPVTNVSWYGAQAYCEYFGMRLPSEAEWEKAARGRDGRTYPWGDTADAGRLNAGSRVGDTTPVGSYPDGRSPYGVYDLAGNVWEWTLDWYEAYPGYRGDESFFGQKYKVVRGGSWNHPDADARAAHRDIAHPARRIHVVGFRCARSGE